MVIIKPMLAKIDNFNNNDNISLDIPYHLHSYVMKMITTPYTFLTPYNILANLCFCVNSILQFIPF